MSELILVSDSKAVECTGLPMNIVSLRAQGHKNCTSLANGLEYVAHCFNPELDQINPNDACNLAARLLLFDGRELCSECPKNEDIEEDLTIFYLKNRLRIL